MEPLCKCKNCGQPITGLPHVCASKNNPMLLQMHRQDVLIILRGLIQYYSALEEQVDRAKVEKMMMWLREQLDEEC